MKKVTSILAVVALFVGLASFANTTTTDDEVLENMAIQANDKNGHTGSGGSGGQ